MFQKKEIRFCVIFSFIALLAIGVFVFSLVFCYDVGYNQYSEILLITIVLSAVIVVLSIVSMIIFIIKNKRSYLNLYRPIMEKVTVYLFDINLEKNKVLLSKQLAAFLGVTSTNFTIDGFKNIFTNIKDFEDVTYESLLANRSMIIKAVAKNGKHITLTCFPNVYSRREHIVGYVNDFTLEFIQEESLIKAATFDTLTGTYRRSYFVKIVKEKMENVQNKGALVFLDVDNFKAINDRYGHDCGDVVLMKLGAVLRNFSKGKDLIVSRSGGDEFLLYFYSLPNYAAVNPLLKELIYAIKTISVSEVGLRQVYVSMGVSFFPMHSKSYEVLLKYADDCLYKSKTLYTSAYSIYNSDIIQNELNIPSESVLTIDKTKNIDIFDGKDLSQTLKILNESMKNNEFKIYAQPEINLVDAGVNIECLCRWETKTDGVLSPNMFIPYFERTDKIFDFDLFMFEKVLKYVEANKDKVKNIQFGINQSMKTMIDPKYAEIINKIAAKYKVPKGSIAVEITEKAMFSGIRHIRKVIELFHSLGFNVIIDDFGTGFTSLEIIKDLHVEWIKIDKSFLTNPDEDYKKCTQIIGGIANLARSINIKTILEGIENEQDFKIASDAKVDSLQGFVFSKAIPVDDFWKEYKNGTYQKILSECKTKIAKDKK